MQASFRSSSRKARAIRSHQSRYVMKVQDSVAFVTGANRGLGLAFTKGLLMRGARKVYAGVRNIESVTMPDVIPVKIDVTDFASVGVAAALCGDVTLLVNNAGIAPGNTGALDPGMIGTAREICETNFFGVIRTSQAFAP